MSVRGKGFVKGKMRRDGLMPPLFAASFLIQLTASPRLSLWFIKHAERLLEFRPLMENPGDLSNGFFTGETHGNLMEMG
ncbi:hypothetical protein CCP4SC76_1890004 [Gammaproteobacteria bacterium]